MTGDGLALASFAAACRARGLSVTHQRLAVYEALLASRSHPDAEQIYEAVRSACPTISRGTVYRCLDLLRSLGLVSEVGRARGGVRYEAALEPHHHLICLGCRRIIDLHDESLDRLVLGPGRRQAAARRGGRTSGFEVTGCQVQFVGYCRACRQHHRRRAGRKQLHP